MILAAVLAAICSTADSQLVVAASALASDIFSRLVEKRRRRFHGLINKATVFVLGVIAVALVIDEEIRVYKYVLTYGWAILGASFAPQIILALTWKRASYAGCLAGMITGFLVALIWPHVYDPGPDGIEIYNLPLAFAAALLVNIVASLIAPDAERPTDVAEAEVSSGTGTD
jgi:sodium/proline symporter